ncbi:MAG: hypothetical protein ACH34X_11140 [Thiolinea sp.]
MITISEKVEVEARQNKILLDGQEIGKLEYDSRRKENYRAILTIPKSNRERFYIIGYGTNAHDAILAAAEKAVQEAKTIYDNVNEMARRISDIGALTN